MATSITPTSPSDIESALQFITPDIARDDWVKIGMAIHSELGEDGFNLFDTWSSNGHTYEPASTKSAWKSFDSSCGVTIATVFKTAQENGYKRKSNDQVNQPAPRPVIPPVSPAEAAKKAQAAKDKAQALWSKTQPCKTHQYTTDKGINPIGARRKGPDLVIPMYSADWQLLSVQIIGPNGKKRFLKGCPVSGLYYAIGKLVNKRIIIAEGYATAVSIRMATGESVAVAFSSGNMPKIARMLRERKPDFEIILAPDADESRHAIDIAEKAAIEHSCTVVYPKFSEGETGTDWNDLHQAAGLDEVRRQIENYNYRPVKVQEPVPPKTIYQEHEVSLNEFPAHSDLVTQRLADGPLVGALMQKPTEDNVALAFAEIFSGDYIYLHGHDKWFHWDGRRFCRDVTGTVREMVRQLARAYNVAGKTTPAKNMFTTGVLGVCMTDPTFSRDAADFDRDNYLLNCPDATYNLRDCTRHEHDPKDHITLITAVSPNPKGGARFLKFLQEIFDGDQEIIDWMQMALGSCLSGAVEDHWLMFWTGSGRNGKNTLGDLVLAILGDYAKAIPAEILMNRKNQEHKTEIMNLKGVRLAVASEIEENDFWAESKLKSLTGDAVLSGRFMRRNFVQFKRTHKHLIYGNHRPQLRNVDAALRSRLKIVPFTVSFVGREDAELPAKLWAEAEYVLHWLMEGHKAWMRADRKLGTCPALEAQADDYFSMQATVESWLDERCRLVSDERSSYEWVQASQLYKDYKDWCAEMGVGARSLPRFGERLQAIGFERVKSNGFRYVGLELLNSSPATKAG